MPSLPPLRRSCRAPAADALPPPGPGAAGYTGEPLSRWCANTKMGKNSDPNEDRAVFVVRQGGGGAGGCREAAGAEQAARLPTALPALRCS